jgi:predicted ATPase/DNA-binding SARP family transcriptional activator
VRYLILGATEVRDARGRPVPLGGRRLRALLTALALRAGSDAPVPVDVLIDEVWPGPDALPADAPAALQALVGRLRRSLGRDAVRSLPGGYRLHAAADDVDLLRFQQLARRGARALDEGDPATAAGLLREALALWRGPALADLPDRASAAGRPDALRHTALQRRIAADLALGHADRVLPELRALTADHPLDEPLNVLYLRALRATGRTAEALEAYETVRRATADRLGTDPGGELRALHAALLAETTPGAPAAAAAPAPAAGPSARPAGPPGNLRARLNSFVGRETDLTTLRADLDASRLVTLTGPGGSGKTRLAERAATDVSTATEAFPDGAWLVELASIDHAAAVPGAVLSALGRRSTSLFPALDAARPAPHDHTVDATERLLELCARRRLLLVLDNCEHLVEAAAALTDVLLTHCPGLTVLATSREPLGVPGETVRPVEPLPPAPAHRLFAERGAEARPGFRPEATQQDAAAVPCAQGARGGPRSDDVVAEICRRLDGLPLAIELAAARLRFLTPAQIAERLDDRFRLLTTGSRTVLPRQQTLRAVVDWSWDLLDAGERTVLRRLAVFAGGCTLSAAEHVCAGPGPEDGDAGSGPDVMNVLSALVDKSLLIADTSAAAAHTGVRYRMLETIHAYARERAAEHPDDLARTETRHTAQILRFVTAAEPRLRSADQLSWLPRVEADLDNVRAVLDRAVRRADTATLIAVIEAMGWFWWLRNYRDEGARWITRVLELLTDRTGVQARLLQLLRYFLLHEQQGQQQLRSPEADRVGKAIAESFREPRPEGARFPGLLWPFAAFLSEGSGGVSALMNLAVANCRAQGGPWELGAVLLFRAHLAVDTPGGLARAVADAAEIDELSHAAGDRWLLSQACGLRAEIDVVHGRHAQARAEYRTALRHADALGAHTEACFLLARVADTHYRQGDERQADEIAERAVREAERLGVADARFYATLLRTVIALDRGEVPQARTLFTETRQWAEGGTPPAMLDAALLTLEARVTAAEGDDPLRAVRLARDALRRGEQTDSPEVIRAAALLGAAAATLVLGRPATAVRLADAARVVRGDLPAGVPDQREDRRIRAAAARATAAAPSDAEEPAAADGEVTTIGQAATLLEKILAAAGAPVSDN